MPLTSSCDALNMAGTAWWESERQAELKSTSVGGCGMSDSVDCEGSISDIIAPSLVGVAGSAGRSWREEEICRKGNEGGDEGGNERGSRGVRISAHLAGITKKRVVWCCNVVLASKRSRGEVSVTVNGEWRQNQCVTLLFL